MKRVENYNENNKILLNEISSKNIQQIIDDLKSNEKGLSEEEVDEKRKIFGLNEIVYEKAPTWYIQLMLSFISPFNAVLFFIAVISLFMDEFISSTGDTDFRTVGAVMAMIIFSSMLKFWQEFRGNKAAQKLKSMVKTNANVLRQNQVLKNIEVKELVPGDIVVISAGDMIPADCRILESKDLFISQSLLSGESLPIEKTEKTLSSVENKTIIELNNICFLGTNVISGSAKIIVINTGVNTYFGSISQSIVKKNPENNFEIGIKSVSWMLIKIMLIMVPLVFLINGLTKGNWIEAFLFAIAIAVGLTPEMLPMIVAANLSRGALKMSKQKVIVKRLNSIENIGAMDVLCTDKTGTLTLDKIVLERHLNINGDEDLEVLKWAYLNSYHQTGLRSIMDKAILEHLEVHEHIKVDEYYKKVDEIPFDFQRRRMSVILEQKNNKHLLICKGAVEEMMDLCSFVFDPGEDHELHIESDKIVVLNEEAKQNIINTTRKLNEDGLRVLMVAIREFESRPNNYKIEDESDLIVTGFIGFLDPAKPSAKPAIESLNKLGISIKIITGDNEVVTKKICKDIGIPLGKIILGNELDKINDKDLAEIIESITIFAKLNPTQKSRIVKSLQQKGHVVGFMGDGINDAAALKDADIGISVDTATDIAKESADIILFEKDLMVLKAGVIYGRRTFGNIIKYIKMTVSSNFGNMFSMIGASALFPFLPMLPIQILVQNLLYDVSQTSIPWDKMDEEYIVSPPKWDVKSIIRFMIYIGSISSLFDYITFALMYFVFKANDIEHQHLFQSGWFIEGLLSQTLIVHMIRTRKIPFIESIAATPVILLTILVIVIGMIIPFSSFATSLKLTKLPFSYFLWLFLILLCYFALTQFVKIIFIKKFKQWL
jgi:Mg2+-importing ATPase